jgi:formylglycine-generating enzyme required for sulfatase activity
MFMPRCPVCQTRYTKDKTEYCTLCGWNLNSYSLVVGMLPEVFLKEKDRIDWAKGLWATVKPNRDLITQLQLKLKDTTAAQANYQAQLAAAEQAQTQFQQLLNQRDADLKQSQANLLEAQQSLEQLQSQIQQIQQDYDRLLTAFNQQSSELAQPQPPPSAQPAPPYLAVPVPDSEGAASAPVLQPFSFTIVAVDAFGQIQTQKTGSAELFVEPLAAESLDMIAIPTGQFEQGSPEDEEGRESHESPQHRVTIPAFYLSRFPITQAQWRVVAQWSAIYRSLDPDPSTFKGDHHPVEQVCWTDAIEFCARLAQATARPYRLPSEAEWEYACRAGTQTPFYCGATLTTDLANYDGNYTYADASEGRYYQRTLTVGSFQTTNAFGLSDMHGNVWEWCADPWHDNYQGAPADHRVWEQDGNLSQRLLRGGAWYCLPCLCRAAQRHWGNVDHSGSGIGFRVACSNSELS